MNGFDQLLNSTVTYVGNQFLITWNGSTTYNVYALDHGGELVAVDRFTCYEGDPRDNSESWVADYIDGF